VEAKLFFAQMTSPVDSFYSINSNVEAQKDKSANGKDNFGYKGSNTEIISSKNRQ
jgi:hypothetical protein